MASLLRVEGTWPDPVTVSAGWFRARARPWNDVVPDPMMRLDRGGTEFVLAAAKRLIELGCERVFSPALYGSATRVWRRAGFETHATVGVMERSLSEKSGQEANGLVEHSARPDWDAVTAIDHRAFAGFWRMSQLGLREAFDTNRKSTLLVAHVDQILAGYAIVGTQWGVTYLHRIAVDPDRYGQGLGASLVSEAIDWGRGTGAKTMVLNVRDDNDRARRLYKSAGFTDTGTNLEILRFSAA